MKYGNHGSKGGGGGGSVGRSRGKNMGWSDGGSSGGYQSIKCADGEKQAMANSYSCCNESAARVRGKSQPNHVGGSRAGA